MDLGIFQKATEIYGKLGLINEIIFAVTNEHTSGMAFGNKMTKLVKQDMDAFLTWINDLRIKYETEFNDLHCECAPETDDGNSTEQDNPKL